jgi:hypothetical protein
MVLAQNCVQWQALVLWHGEWKNQPLLGSGTINSDATVEHITLCNITNLSTTWNGVFYAVCANSYIMQQ